MWGKFAIAFVCWLAALIGVIKLIHALPHNPGGGFLYHDSVAMILVGGFFLLSAMTIKKIHYFLGYPSQDSGLSTSYVAINTPR
ncbi:MAG: hypothetical protein WCF40_09405 [Desulfobacterales bacterium]|jgi:hypothetical protein